MLRAEVQLRTEEQRLLAQKNQVEKDKLTLARAIGLPAGQQFQLSDVCLSRRCRERLTIF